MTNLQATTTLALTLLNGLSWVFCAQFAVYDEAMENPNLAYLTMDVHDKVKSSGFHVQLFADMKAEVFHEGLVSEAMAARQREIRAALVKAGFSVDLDDEEVIV